MFTCYTISFTKYIHVSQHIKSTLNIRSNINFIALKSAVICI